MSKNTNSKHAFHKYPSLNTSGKQKGYDIKAWDTCDGPEKACTIDSMPKNSEILQGGEHLPQQLPLNVGNHIMLPTYDGSAAVGNNRTGKKIMYENHHTNIHNNTAAIQSRQKRMERKEYLARRRVPTTSGKQEDHDTNKPDDNAATLRCVPITSGKQQDHDTNKPDDICNKISTISNTEANGAPLCNRRIELLTQQSPLNTPKDTCDRVAAFDKKTKGKNNIQSYLGLQNTHLKGYLCTPSAETHGQGVSSLYIDLGDPDYECQHCNAIFWYNERLKGNEHQRCPKYTKCCGGGQVWLQKEIDPPEYFKYLLKNKHFIDNIRAYNQMFSMTSFGAQIDESINNGKGPYVFKISSELHHWVGTLCPTNEKDPKFLQLYIYDTKNEVQNRMQPFGGTEQSGLKAEIVEGLIQTLDEHNELVKLFRTARDKINEGNVPEFKIQLYNVIGAREYQLPSSGTLGAIVFQPDPTSQTDYDMIIEYKDRKPKRINKLHSSYMSLQFPLLFVYGQPGYNTEMTLREVHPNKRKKKLSMNMYYKYQIHEKSNQFNLLFKAGRLFQQYVVVAYCAIEQTRIDFIRSKQNNLRTECLSGICDAISKGDHFGSDIGQKIILPSSFTGGPRYMYSHYLDALAICRVLGNPQYFITFTCNANWPEIKRRMKRSPELTTADRPEIVVRVFQEKVEDFLTVLKEGKIFGRCTGVLYTIEFQKRGLPHCHTLIWIDARDRIKNPEEIDNFISAELPDKTTDPEGYKVVGDMMMHGPCGNINPGATCMQDNVCSKHFPKKYNETTYFDENGHIHYRRRKGTSYISRGEVRLDNTNVVPYNRVLCLMFHAHINVEYCGWSMLIKYLFKYISKGTDRIAARIIKPIGDPAPSSSIPKIKIDEIKNFIDGRFISPPEACWRILDFPIHYREPSVQILAVHLEDMQKMTFRDSEPLRYVASDDRRKLTTLTQWFAYNAMFEDGRHLTYLDFPSEYVWYENTKRWQRRKIKGKYSIGRLVYVHPAAGELFYFRMLLNGTS